MKILIFLLIIKVIFIVKAPNPLTNNVSSIQGGGSVVPISMESFKNTGELKLNEIPIYGQKDNEELIEKEKDLINPKLKKEIILINENNKKEEIIGEKKKKKKKNKNKKNKAFFDPKNKYSLLSEINEEKQKKLFNEEDENIRKKGKEENKEEEDKCNEICDDDDEDEEDDNIVNTPLETNRKIRGRSLKSVNANIKKGGGGGGGHGGGGGGHGGGGGRGGSFGGSGGKGGFSGGKGGYSGKGGYGKPEGSTKGYYNRPYYGSSGVYVFPSYYPYGGYYVGDSTPSSDNDGSCCTRHTVTLVVTMMLAFHALSPGVQMGCRIYPDLGIYSLPNCIIDNNSNSSTGQQTYKCDFSAAYRIRSKKFHKHSKKGPFKLLCPIGESGDTKVLLEANATCNIDEKRLCHLRFDKTLNDTINGTN